MAAISLAVIIATPDGSVPDRGFIHGGFAILLYASLVAVVGLSASHLLRGGIRVAGFLALGVAITTAIFLWLSLRDTASGLFQRLGLTTSLWLMAVGLRGGPVPAR